MTARDDKTAPAATAELTEDQLDQLLVDIGLRRYRPRVPHGTPSAYTRHLRHGEEPCDACRKANREVKRAKAAQARAGQIQPGRRKPIAHGTAKGYKQHRYRGEEPCEACREANRKAERERLRRKGGVA